MLKVSGNTYPESDYRSAGREVKDLQLSSKSKDFVTSRVAAQILGVSLTTVQLWVEGGILRAWKTAGGHRRIARSSVDELLQEQRRALEGKPAIDRLTVVAVDDDELQLEFYRIKFEEWGQPIKLILASNGFEGLIQVGQHAPDVIICDLEMLGMDGLEMIKMISQNRGLDSAQLIVVTGSGESEIASRGELPAGLLVIYKPIKFEALKAIIGDRIPVNERIKARHAAKPNSRQFRREIPDTKNEYVCNR